MPPPLQKKALGERLGVFSSAPVLGFQRGSASWRRQRCEGRGCWGDPRRTSRSRRLKGLIPFFFSRNMFSHSLGRLGNSEG